MAWGLKTIADNHAIGRALVIPKNSEKCRMILRCGEQNLTGGVKPKGFYLPQVEEIRDRLVFENKPSWWWMCKLDVSNCYWRIRLLAQWMKNFNIYMLGEGGGGCRWTRLPFGWSFSAVVCHNLISGIVRGVLALLQSYWFVYLDDILLVASRSHVKRGARSVAQKLRLVRFLISPKSVCQPTQTLDFIRKWFDTQKGSAGNRQELLGGIPGLWVLAVIGPFESLLMSRRLAHLQLAKTHSGAAAFLASAYQVPRIPRDLPQTNSVGELLVALDAAKTFSRSPKVVLVIDSTYVWNGFSSVRKCSVNGWSLPCGQRVAHREMRQEVLQMLDEKGPRLRVLWCPSHEGIPGK